MQKAWLAYEYPWKIPLFQNKLNAQEVAANSTDNVGLSGVEVNITSRLKNTLATSPVDIFSYKESVFSFSNNTLQYFFRSFIGFYAKLLLIRMGLV